MKPDEKRRRPDWAESVEWCDENHDRIMTKLARIYDECVLYAAARKRHDAIADADAEYIAAGGRLKSYALRSTIPPLSIELDFIRIASLWATNEQLARYLHGPVTKKTLGRVRTAIKELRRMGCLVEQPRGPRMREQTVVRRLTRRTFR